MKKAPTKPQPRITYESLNTLKGLACIGVVYLHCSFPGVLGKSLLYAMKFAVPVFFMISGFFLYSSDKQDIQSKINRQLRKILRILLVSIALYAMFDFICSKWVIDSCSSAEQWISRSLPSSLCSFVQQIVFGTFFNNTLWYFHALIFAYLLIGPIIKHISPRWIAVSVSLLFVIHITTRVYVRAMDFDWYEANYWRSFLLTGLPWMLTGYIIACYRNQICERVSWKGLIGMILVGYFLQNVEYKIYSQSISFYFSTIVYCVSLFLLCIKYPHYKGSKVLNYIGQKLSLDIYIVHYAVLVIINDIIPRNAVITDWTAPIFSIVISILAAFLYKNIEQKMIKINTNNK